MKVNIDNCHLRLSTGNTNQIQTENSVVKSSPCKKRLGAKFDHELTFDNYVKDLCKKTNEKINIFVQSHSIYGNIIKNQ